MQAFEIVSNKVVLITGGTGSFGNVMVHHALKMGCEEVRILSRDEAKQDEMRRLLKDPRIKFHIGDIRDRDSVDRAMRGTNLVFHAAALKQVPSCEFFPLQAVKTNVLGSQNVIDSAIQFDVERAVFLSTDKAVLPVNAMGMSKAMMEKLVTAAAMAIGSEGPTLNCVRYGNVLYSRGSVLPVFIRQACADEPLTVTNPEMTRFLMPLTDSVSLVEHAWKHGKQGDILIKKAVACNMGDFAKAVIQMFKSKSEIKIIGTRHAEKVYETLATGEELSKSDDNGDYIRVRMDSRDLNYDNYFVEGSIEVSEMDQFNSHNAKLLNVDQIIELLKTLPEIQKDLRDEGLV